TNPCSTSVPSSLRSPCSTKVRPPSDDVAYAMSYAAKLSGAAFSQCAIRTSDVIGTTDGKSAQLTTKSSPVATVRGSVQPSPPSTEKRSASTPSSAGSSQLNTSIPSGPSVNRACPLPGPAGTASSTGASGRETPSPLHPVVISKAAAAAIRSELPRRDRAWVISSWQSIIDTCESVDEGRRNVQCGDAEQRSPEPVARKEHAADRAPAAVRELMNATASAEHRQRLLQHARLARGREQQQRQAADHEIHGAAQALQMTSQTFGITGHDGALRKAPPQHRREILVLLDQVKVGRMNAPLEDRVRERPGTSTELEDACTGPEARDHERSYLADAQRDVADGQRVLRPAQEEAGGLGRNPWF